MTAPLNDISIPVDTSQYDSFLLLLVAPKMKFGTDNEQSRTRDGNIPEWDVQIAAAKQRFGQPQNQILNVTVASRDDPSRKLSTHTLVSLVGLEVNIRPAMRKGRDGRDYQNGINAFWRCADIEPADASARRLHQVSTGS